MATVQRYNLLMSAGAIAASLVLSSPRFAGSLALGALVETVNFRALWRFSQRGLFAGAAAPHLAVWAFAMRFLVLGFVVWALLASGAHPIGFLLGLSLIVPAMLLAAWRNRPAPGPLTSGPPPDDESWERWDPWLARERDPDEEEW
jgi:hypothetical protein